MNTKKCQTIRMLGKFTNAAVLPMRMLVCELTLLWNRTSEMFSVFAFQHFVCELGLLELHSFPKEKYRMQYCNQSTMHATIRATLNVFSYLTIKSICMVKTNHTNLNPWLNNGQFAWLLSTVNNGALVRTVPM